MKLDVAIDAKAMPKVAEGKFNILIKVGVTGCAKLKASPWSVNIEKNIISSFFIIYANHACADALC